MTYQQNRNKYHIRQQSSICRAWHITESDAK